MADFEEPEQIWDEYDWERFLQQQDQKTERYMELLEKYIDDPDRDQIIAREMGWSHLMTSDDDDDEEEGWIEISFQPDGSVEKRDRALLDDVEALEEEIYIDNESFDFDLGDDDDDEEEEDEDEEAEGFELHPLYQASFALTIWIDHLFEDLEEIENRPAAVKLATNCAVASAKLAAALSDDETDEIGMTIAYLKRALKAITNALDASQLFGREAKLPAKTRKELHDKLFHVRDGIILLMGEYRSEWRRRYGATE